jgi:tetratricopeptide (TPR) repeat protein
VQHALDVRDADELFAAAERAQSDGRSLDAAECLVSFLRIKTDGNLLRVVGTSDTAENKELWAKHAPVASKLAAEAAAAEPTSVKAKAIYAEARTMQAASKGIVKVATSGELPELQRAVKELREMDATWDLGMAWVFAGSNYLALPWPLGSASKAQDRFKEALKVNKGSSRNLYFAAMAERALGNKEKACTFFEMAAKAASNPLSDSERDVAAFLKEQSEAGAEEARRS